MSTRIDIKNNEADPSKHVYTVAFHSHQILTTVLFSPTLSGDYYVMLTATVFLFKNQL